MPSLDYLLAAFCLVSVFLHVLTTAIAAYRCRRTSDILPPAADAPAVSILRPICGLDSFDHLTLRSTFELDYPNLQIVFCCDDAGDPAAELVRKLIAEHPEVDATLLVGRSRASPNPKLNNLIKGWPCVRSDWLILADCNVLMPRDYVQRLLSGWGSRTGVLCSPPVGHLPVGFWAEVECAFLNTYQARWQYAADTVGVGFAQGKTMVWRHHDLAQAGGLIALGAEVAEDAAATKVVRGLGLRAQLVDAPFKQPLGRRSARQAWDRQARWSRLRRMTFPGFFLPEILTCSLLPLGAAACLAEVVELPAVAVIAAVAALWFGCEAVLAWCAGWHLSLVSPLAWLARDAMLPALWVQAWLLDSFHWRGHEISLEKSEHQTA